MFVPEGGSRKGKSAFLEEKTKHREDRELHRRKTESATRKPELNFKVSIIQWDGENLERIKFGVNSKIANFLSKISE